jgi:hypothetical protein
MWDKLIELGATAFKGDPKADDRAQLQLDRILERRFEPCMALWEILWDFSRKAEARSVELKDVQDLSEALNLFVRTNGILVSFACLKSLLQLQSNIARLLNSSAENFSVFLPEVYQVLVPVSQKGNNEAAPGLLMLMRDQVGSNFKSASAML